MKKYLLISFSNQQDQPPIGSLRRVFYSASRNESRSLRERIREAFNDPKVSFLKVGLGLIGVALFAWAMIVLAWI